LTYQVTPFQVTLLGSGVRLKTPHKCFQVADTYSGGTLHMHQRQLTAGDRALDRPQRNAELVGGIALSYEQ